MGLILFQPELPWRHQGLGLAAPPLEQMQHPPRPTAAGAALRITADRALLIEKAQGLLQHRFRQAELGMGVAEVVHQGGGIAVALQQAIQDPAHGQFKTEVLNGGLLKKGTDASKTRWS